MNVGNLPDTSGVQSRATTPLQQGMLYHSLQSGHAGVDTQQIAIHLENSIDIDRWCLAWKVVVQHYEMLRSTFESNELGETKRVLNPHYQLPIQQHDWTHLKTETDENVARDSFCSEDRRQPFELEKAVPQRMNVFNLPNGRSWVLWSFHHILMDGRSFSLVLKAAFDLYDGVVDELPELTGASVCDYTAKVNQAVGPVSQHFWTDLLARVENVSALRDAPHSKLFEASENAEFCVQERSLSADIGLKLEALAQSRGVSLNTLIQTAWALLLSHRNRQDEVVFGVVRACRHVVPESDALVGLLINTVPMGINIDAEMTLGSLLERVYTIQTQTRDHESTPLAKIGQFSPIDSGAIFETVVMFDKDSLDTKMRKLDETRFSLRRFEYAGQTNFPVTLVVYADNPINFRIEHYSDYCSASLGKKILEELETLLVSMVGEGKIDAAAKSLAYLSGDDLARIDSWNDTAEDFGAFKPLSDILREQRDRTPENTALLFDDQKLSYKNFADSVGKLANYLVACGYGPGSYIGVCVERSFEMLVAIHAVVASGAAFVPLSPEFPDDRLSYMVDNAGIKLVLHQKNLTHRWASDKVDTIDLDNRQLWEHLDTEFPVLDVDAVSPAYVLYTSGSTGMPKGVVNTHEGLINRLSWMQDGLILTHQDTVFQKTPYSFDVSVWELFWPFMVGAKLVIAKPDGHRDPDYLVSTIKEHKVTVLHFVPSMLQLFVDEPNVADCDSIRHLICSGEALPVALAKKVLNLIPCRLHNFYGPTEAAIDVSWWECKRTDSLPFVPIGKPVANTQLHVLDQNLKPVPVGSPGELCIGGSQLALEYCNRDDLTQQSFVQAPIPTYGRLYKTGDLARWTDDGNLEYLGRLDFQVKINGQRVELGEIENVLLTFEAVKEVVVSASAGIEGQNVLTAYIVPHVDLTRLEAHARKRLPEFMVPKAWHCVEKFVLNASGKVDRKKLPTVITRAKNTPYQISNTTVYTEVEENVRSFWIQLLGNSEYSLNDRFFDSGGDSLTLLKLRNLIRSETGHQISVSDLIANSSIKEQAALLANERQNTVANSTQGLDQGQIEKRRQSVAKRRTRRADMRK